VTNKQAQKIIQQATERCRQQLSAQTDRNNLYSRGLSAEGWHGGYMAGLQDCILVLNGVMPNRREYWSAAPPETKEK
jgi:hypothetical protein